MKNHKKKPTLGEVGQKETTALNYKDNYNAFRIRCIMLIVEILKNKITTTTVTKNYIEV